MRTLGKPIIACVNVAIDVACHHDTGCHDQRRSRPGNDLKVFYTCLEGCGNGCEAIVFACKTSLHLIQYWHPGTHSHLLQCSSPACNIGRWTCRCIPASGNLNPIVEAAAAQQSRTAVVECQMLQLCGESCTLVQVASTTLNSFALRSCTIAWRTTAHCPLGFDSAAFAQWPQRWTRDRTTDSNCDVCGICRPQKYIEFQEAVL